VQTFDLEGVCGAVIIVEIMVCIKKNSLHRIFLVLTIIPLSNIPGLQHAL
jgi:hypothetical protein